MKKILLIATGGTIASREDGYGLSPTLTGEELAQSVPEIAGLCEIDVVQPMNIDSTNMSPQDWMCIRDVIAHNYPSYHGFVILHGTDTMAYTAAALSYLVQNSPKPIVLTGSQQPMGHPFTDAKLNLYQSLLWALDDAARDVSIVFGGLVIAGTRARKQRTMSFNAFTSVNFPPLAVIRTDRIIYGAPQHACSRTQPSIQKGVQTNAALMDAEPRFHDVLDGGVCTLRLTPGLTPAIFDLLRPNLSAIILETFGIGGVPDAQSSSPSFESAIFDWVDSGRTLVMTTQVPEEGMDLGVYRVGRTYAEHPGILKGGDMTTEALVAKTLWVLAQTKDPKQIRELFYTPINFDRLD
ncbi:asparaginase [Collinsella sp. AGMB00827]|uniref:asparaginase n=1 Tax=Collinsella ureilytica TaxID=2869515 RepID=A0ABS7MJB1_9ACTN|nr:asparaginase [Collinsella urealyticum]MBY4797398.1 asparaginase [Collinsella urealyticum]